MKKRSTKPEAVAAVTEVFRNYGYEGATLARLSEASGLGRSSLYHHFPNGKEDMAREAVRHVGEIFKTEVGEVLASDGPPEQRIGQVVIAIAAFYEGGSKSCLSDVFGVADAMAVVPDAAGGLLTALINGLAGLAEEAGFGPAEARNRAEACVIDIQGALVLSRAQKDKGPFQRALARLPSKLLD